MGGLSKKAYQMTTLTGNNFPPAILLDAGNLLFKHAAVTHSQELLTAAGLMEIYQQMTYDAVAVGPHDLAAGIEFLKNGRVADFPWLSANLIDRNNTRIFPAVKVITRGIIKVGIIGLTGQIATKSQEAIVDDWRKVLPEQLQRLQTEACQLVVVLSSLSGEDNAELTRQFPQVHLLISADQQQGNLGPKVDNSTLVTQTMSQGKYLGVLDIDWIPGSGWAKSGEEGRITAVKGSAHPRSSFSSNFIPLGKNLPEDRQIAAGIEQIKQQIYKLNQKSAATERQPHGAADPSFKGLTGFSLCRECHALQSQFWSSTKHAGAYATLQQRRQNFNLDCLPCHITRNPAPEGAGSSPLESLLTLPATLQAVGCEVCHGAGLAHAEAPDKVKQQRKVKEKTCTACHSKDRDPAFDYRQKINKVSCPAG